jgi:peptide/nickel transport system substrate-binding protein
MVELMNEIEHKKSSKKTLKEFKKPLIGSGIIASIAIAGIISGFLLIAQEKQNDKVFTYGTHGALYVLDPMLFGNFEVFALLENIVDPLFQYKFTSEGSSIVPCLALNYSWSDGGLNFTCSLRTGVKFHDGTPFNASAVKWNFDRHENLLFSSPGWYLWFHPGWTPILNRTVVIDDYTIRFVLTRPFVPFISLLARGLNMVSPSSTPFDNFTYFDSGNLIGTGPFKHDSTVRSWDPVSEDYIWHNTTLIANHDYYGIGPSFDKIIVKTFDDDEELLEAMLSGEIDAIMSGFPAIVFENKTGINLLEKVNTEVNFITMNNSVINSTMRKAISYGLDYDKLVPYGLNFTGGVTSVVRCKSPLSKGMLYSNWEDFEVPVYNITKSRQFLKDANWPGTSGLTVNDNVSTGNEWEKLVSDGIPLATYNFSYIVGVEWRKEIALLFQNNLTQIGINITTAGKTGPEYWDTLTTDQFILYGWVPDYNDPHNNLLPNFVTFNNYGQVQDAYLEQLIDDGMVETNETAREQIYYDLQRYMIEDLHPVIWWYTTEVFIPISTRIGGYNQYNNYGMAWNEWYFT